MKKLRHLGLFILLSFICLWSQAQEEAPTKNEFMLLSKDVYFQPGGGLRARYENLREATGGAFKSEEDDSSVTHRAQFDFKMY
ncbi:MAG: hypothetical protein HRT44_11775, partial [Bdellovibrionales bacterium]|nr:hypothetical protein [Bdellovibrionales bacterium]NQZ19918.1 hypothetical protein [Bdellovibrionales bacterium]